MGAKIKTPKNPWTKNSPPPPPPKKIPYRTTSPKYASTTTNLYLYQPAQDNTCPIFLPPKLPPPPPPPTKSHTELRGRNTRAPPRIFTYIKPPKIILAQFSYSKNSRNRKFQTQKILLSSPSLEIRSTSTLSLFNLKFLNRKISL